MNTPLIRAMETATLRPSQKVCLGLLGVKALELQEADVAAFLSPASVSLEDRAP